MIEPKTEAEAVRFMADHDARESSEYDSEYLVEQQAHRRGGSNVLSKRAILLHAIFIGVYTTAFWLLSPSWSRSSSITPGSLVYSPAREAVHLKKQRFDAELVIESEYIGEPTPGSDLAWHNLLKNMNIAVPASDLDKIHAHSIAVPDEPGMYVAGLSVYHELHCLKRLRQYTWLDVYFPNQTSEQARLHRLHTDHCIDVLRQAILCRADTSLFTLQWSEAEPMPRADFSHQHECVDWQRLNAWAGERAIPEEKMKRLQHPHFGAAFPDGKGARLGASEDHSPTISEGEAR